MGDGVQEPEINAAYLVEGNLWSCRFGVVQRVGSLLSIKKQILHIRVTRISRTVITKGELIIKQKT